MKKLYVEAFKALQNDDDIALVSVIADSGSTPRGIGAKMLVGKDGYVSGTIGGGAVEFKSIQLAMEAVKDKRSFVQKFTLGKNEAAGLGMICGGNVELFFQYVSAEDKNKGFMENVVAAIDIDENSWLITEICDDCKWNMSIWQEKYEHSNLNDMIPGLKRKSVLLERGKTKHYIEPLTTSEKVYIFGGGHISQKLVPILSSIDFKCVVIDDRSDFADPKLFPKAEKTIVVDFSNISKSIKIKQKDYVAILTRGHKNDYDALVHVLNTDACYIGLVGSRTKLAITKERLLKDGFTEEVFHKVYAPIGLPIKAVTPEEIAISIAAEMVNVRAELNNF